MTANLPTLPLATTQEIIADFKAGRMVILVDEEDRENEGDLVLAADFVTPEAINFMARHARGLICLTLTEARCRELNLPLMTSVNGTRTGTNFTLSIEAAEGVTTGISAADRARTIQVAIAPSTRPRDLVQPGHVFPIMARNGGVLIRGGHTEAGCDLGMLAGITPAAVICEVMKDDGTMARLPDLIEFARRHELKIGTIADLIHYRSAHESLVERLARAPVETPYGLFDMAVYRDKTTDQPHLALVLGSITPEDETLVRVHEPLSVLDWIVAGSRVHSWPIDAAMRAIIAAGKGVLVMLNCTETAADLLQRARAGSGPAQAGVEGQHSRRIAGTDLRNYGIGAQILKDLGVRRMRVLSTPRRMPSMTGFDLEVTGFVEDRS